MKNFETNLVGEEIELIEIRENSRDLTRHRLVIARGTCRAATIGSHDGVLVLWLELTERSVHYYLFQAEIGDVIRIPTNDGGHSKILRIIKR